MKLFVSESGKPKLVLLTAQRTSVSILLTATPMLPSLSHSQHHASQLHSLTFTNTRITCSCISSTLFGDPLDQGKPIPCSAAFDVSTIASSNSTVRRSYRYICPVDSLHILVFSYKQCTSSLSLFHHVKQTHEVDGITLFNFWGPRPKSQVKPVPHSEEG